MQLQDVLEQLGEVIEIDRHGECQITWHVLVAVTEQQPEMLLCKLRLAVRDFDVVYQHKWIAERGILLISEC